MIKPGYKTSEFWFTLVSFIFSGLYLTGILTENEQKEELITVVSHAVESVILISGQVLILYKYIKGRNTVKEKFINRNRGDSDDSKRDGVQPSRKSKPRTKRVAKKPKKRGPE